MKRNLIVMITILSVLVLMAIIWKIKPGASNFSDVPGASNIPASDKLTIVSTNPDPLNESTILPSQSIELTFNKALSLSELKYKLEPDFDHTVEATGSGATSTFGKTFKITPKKALELGSGFTLFVNSATQAEDKTNLDHDYIYHVNTLKYKGN